MAQTNYVPPNMDNRFLLPGRAGQGFAPSGTSMSDPNDPLFQAFMQNQGYPASYRAGLAANSGYQAPGSPGAMNDQIKNSVLQQIAGSLPGGGGSPAGGGGAGVPPLPARTDLSALQTAANWRPSPLPAAPSLPGRAAPPERIGAAPEGPDWKPQYRPGAAAPIRGLNPLGNVKRPELAAPTMNAPGRLELPSSPMANGPTPPRVGTPFRQKLDAMRAGDNAGGAAPRRPLPAQGPAMGQDQMRSLVDAWMKRRNMR